MRKRMRCGITKRILAAGALAMLAIASVGAGVSMQAKAAQTNKGVKIGEAHFPDANFRNVVAEYDENDDGVLSPREAKKVTKLQSIQSGLNDTKNLFRKISASDDIMQSVRSGFFRLINWVKSLGCGMVIGRKMIEEKE